MSLEDVNLRAKKRLWATAQIAVPVGTGILIGQLDLPLWPCVLIFSLGIVSGWLFRDPWEKTDAG